LLGATLLLVPIGVLIGLLLAREQLDDLGLEAVPLVETVQITELDERTGVAAEFTWVDGPMLYAPAWSGLVGRVDMATGGTVRSGDVVATVDGLVRMAVATPQPFYRSLGLGDEGPDVGWLRQVLIDLGYLQRSAGREGSVDDLMVAAVRSLSRDLGVTPAADAFDPAWFVWLPADPFAVAAVDLIAGAPAPAAGIPIAGSRPQLGDVALQRVDGAPITLEPGVQYVLDISGTEIQLQDTATISESGLAQLSKALPAGLDSAAASYRRTEPLRVWSVPSAAVMAGSDSHLCLWVAASAEFEAVSVEVIGGRAGVSFVRPPQSTADVLQNPSQILPEPACP
jgi:peptidoglycan hydrolase-like protein with peptidoglycan-binding domain